jgi:hypothetical protein
MIKRLGCLLLGLAAMVAVIAGMPSTVAARSGRRPW